jgi:phosphoenolpyruvate synthase/pyruvate phosphate dikinase
MNILEYKQRIQEIAGELENHLDTSEDPRLSPEIQRIFQDIDLSLLLSLRTRNLDPSSKINQQPLAQCVITAGGGSGEIVFTATAAKECVEANRPYIFVHENPTPEHDLAMKNAQAIVVGSGATSHAVRQSLIFGVPCCYGVQGISGDLLTLGDTQLDSGESIAVDNSGIYQGDFETIEPIDPQCIQTIETVARRVLRDEPTVAALVHTPEDIQQALGYDAEKLVWLTEYMFEEQQEKFDLLHQFILSHKAHSKEASPEVRSEMLKSYIAAASNPNTSSLPDSTKRLMARLIKDFEGTFKAIAAHLGENSRSPALLLRLFDPAADEIIPQSAESRADLQRYLNLQDGKALKETLAPFKKATDPAMDIRGSRILECYPEVYFLQMTCIMRALKNTLEEHPNFSPSIMAPMIATPKEFFGVVNVLDTIANGMDLTQKNYKLACMAEIASTYYPQFLQGIAAGLPGRSVELSHGSNDGVSSLFLLARTCDYAPDSNAKTLLPDVMQTAMMTTAQTAEQLNQDHKAQRYTVGICGSHGMHPVNHPFLMEHMKYISTPCSMLPLTRIAMAKHVLGASHFQTELQLFGPNSNGNQRCI